MLEFVCLPWSEVCSARVTSLLLLLLLLLGAVLGQMPTITASFQEKCDVFFPDRVSHIAMVSLVAIPQSKDKDNPMNMIWWSRCLISKNVASYILADAQNVP